MGDYEAIADCMTEVNTLKQLRDVPSIIRLRQALTVRQPKAMTQFTVQWQKVYLNFASPVVILKAEAHGPLVANIVIHLCIIFQVYAQGSGLHGCKG